MTKKQKRELRKAKVIRVASIVLVAATFAFTEMIIVDGFSEDAEKEIETVVVEPEAETQVSVTVHYSAITMMAGEVTKVPEVTEVVTEPQQTTYWVEVPLDRELQEVLVRLCDKYSVPVSIALGLMEQESSFRTSVVSKTNDYGLCQINEGNIEWMKEALGVTDILEPEQNIECGLYILGMLYEEYQDWNMALMCYNCGENGAYRNYFSKGQYSNSYSTSVLEYSEKWEAIVNE